jgi:transcriptional regulator with XRE-family HTH domain
MAVGRHVSREDRDIAARIRSARAASGTTQLDLARVLGVTAQQMTKYERGISRVTAGQLVLIARALGVPIAHLLGEDGGVSFVPRARATTSSSTTSARSMRASKTRCSKSYGRSRRAPKRANRGARVRIAERDRGSRAMAYSIALSPPSAPGAALAGSSAKPGRTPSALYSRRAIRVWLSDDGSAPIVPVNPGRRNGQRRAAVHWTIVRRLAAADGFAQSLFGIPRKSR